MGEVNSRLFLLSLFRLVAEVLERSTEIGSWGSAFRNREVV